MYSPHQTLPLYGNRLLAAFPGEEYGRLLPHLESVRLPWGGILYNPGDPVQHAYFLKCGAVSILSTTKDGKAVEVATIGREGMVGISVSLRTITSPYQIIVTARADAVRIREDILESEFNRSVRLRDSLLRYTQTMLTQIAQATACQRFHTVQARLCRWLLVSQDHLQKDTINLTHEFLSYLMGVPRTSITSTFGELRRAGFLGVCRGGVQIIDRKGLEDASCDCYQSSREETHYFEAAVIRPLF
jgi:CRP-like cAMP-binding protein